MLIQAGRTARAMSGPLRYASFAIDSVLLGVALLLLTIVPAVVYANGWLLTKLLLLPVYVTLGWLALHKARARASQFALLAGALLTYVTMFTIARAHDPLGWLRPWAGD